MRVAAARLSLVLALHLLGKAGHAEVPPHPAVAQTGVDEKRGDPVPGDIRLERTNGTPVHLDDLWRPGHPVILTLAYSDCPMLCSLVLRGVAKLVGDLGNRWVPGEDLSLVTVSIDPNETQLTAQRKEEVLLEQIGRAETPGAWTYLTGTKDQVDRLADALGFRYSRDPHSGQYAHPAVAFVLTPNGIISDYLYGLQHDPTRVGRALQVSLGGEVTQGTPSVVEAVLSCFRFDPASRKYGWVITALLKTGGALLLVAMLAGVGVLIARDRRRA